MSLLLWDAALEHQLRLELGPLASGAGPFHLPDLPPAAEAWAVHALARMTGATVLWITDGPRTLEWRRRDFQSLLPPGGCEPLCFPSWELLPAANQAGPEASLTGARLACLQALRHHTPGVVITCAQALLECTLPPAMLDATSRRLKRGDDVDTADLCKQLEETGYAFAPEVQSPGQAAMRGGILDLWPPSSPHPLRLEFFGSTLESIRTFDPAEQHSLEPVQEAFLTPAGEWALLRPSPADAATLPDHLPPGPLIVVWSDVEAIRQHTDAFESSAREGKATALIRRFADLEVRLQARAGTRHLYVGSAPGTPCEERELDLLAIDPLPSTTARHALHPDVVETARRAFLATARGRLQERGTVLFLFDSEGALERFREAYGEIFGDHWPTLALAPLSGGFTSAALNLLVVTEGDLYGRKIQRRRLLPRPAADRGAGGARLSDWTDMEPGHLVVHVEHGVGRYLGLREIQVGGQLQEALAIEYAEGAKLYVPVAQAHLLTRYVGIGKRHVVLHTLGGKRWDREKLAAERAVQDLAGSLLEIQAARDSQEGFAYPPDMPWQHELEAAFPYAETEDQLAAIREVKKDMESKRPMDRLLCGDAGYGKTEVALRAAFKAVLAGRQVALLVPTTILAQQHFQTFTERMAAYPVRIEMLSRFCSRSESGAVVHGLAEGTVDIVIGTHALLQPALVFKNLGLVIIDEEQKFGVLHKERFKHIRRLVDVLTLTATPIPRTLYMSLTGARDLSTIQTPPQERLVVETTIAPDSDAVIREAVMRELNRGGQVFYVHNRIRSIERLRERLQRLVPEARIGVGHGQMSAGDLAEIMRQFCAGEFDLLLCTTIIESGVDIPQANTIVIDRADRFGLAELYQLRGRVGRSRHKAYATLLLPSQAHVDPVARRRMQAIKQYSGAGAGFRLAMRDLEIRGAGNILGASQSGHIAAVGFGLYCQLLRHTIAQRKGEALPPVIDVELALDFISLSPSHAGAGHCALIPVTYVEDERLRVSLYRRIAEAAFVKEVRALRKTFRDRFGPLPPACERLLILAEIRILAAGKSLQSVAVEAGKVMLKRRGEYVMTGNRFTRLRQTDPDNQLAELRDLLRHLP